MVTKPAPEAGDTISTDVTPGESLTELNVKHFGNYIEANSRVKWIHLGRTLEHRLPTNIESGTVFHVYAEPFIHCMHYFLVLSDPQYPQVKDLIMNPANWMRMRIKSTGLYLYSFMVFLSL